MKVVSALIAPLLLLSVLQSTSAISCYNCSSYDDPACATLERNDTTSKYYVNCTATDMFCRKTVITIIDSDRYVRVTRSCGSVKYRQAVDNCYENDDEFKFERSCQCFTDGCNHSITLQHSALLAIAAICSNVFLYKF